MSSRDNPFEMIQRMFEQMSRQFDEASRSWRPGEESLGPSTLGTMGVDVADRGEEFVVTADLPGFETDDVDLRLVGDALVIDARREETTEQRDETYLRSERQHRSMTERVELPAAVDEAAVEATLRNGVLTVTLPKAGPEGEGGRRIDIE